MSDWTAATVVAGVKISCEARKKIHGNRLKFLKSVKAMQQLKEMHNLHLLMYSFYDLLFHF